MINLSGPGALSSSTSSIAGSGLSSKYDKVQFLFTSDFERSSWLEEINGAIYACKFILFDRKTKPYFILFL